MKQRQHQQASKPRRVLLFVLFLLMLGGLHLFGTLISRPIPWWFTLGWLVVTGLVCKGGWQEDEDQPPPGWMSSRPLQRLGYLFVLLAGSGMCWLGWTGWKARDGGGLTGLLAIFLPVGALWLLWLAGKLLFRLLAGR